MKIDVYITDATPDELRGLFAWGSTVRVVDRPTAGLPTVQKKKIDARHAAHANKGKKNYAGKGKHGDLKIPFSTTTHKKEYFRAWRLCRKHGWLPYPEALALEDKSVENIQKSTEKVTEDPAKGVRPQEIKIQDVAKIQPQNSVVLSHPEIATGMHVRQISSVPVSWFPGMARSSRSGMAAGHRTRSLLRVSNLPMGRKRRPARWCHHDRRSSHHRNRSRTGRAGDGYRPTDGMQPNHDIKHHAQASIPFQDYNVK